MDITLKSRFLLGPYQDFASSAAGVIPPAAASSDGSYHGNPDLAPAPAAAAGPIRAI